MRWLDRLLHPTEYFARQRSVRVLTEVTDFWQRNHPLTDLWDIKTFAEDGYRRNTLIFACTTMTANAFARPPVTAWTINSQGDEVDIPPGHLLYLPLRRPNERQSWSALIRAASTHLSVAGNCYFYKVRSKGGNVVNLKLLRPDLTWPIPDSNGDLGAYSYGRYAQSGTFTDAQLRSGVEDPTGYCQIIPKRDVIHEIANPDPLEPFRGISPIAVLARFGDLDNYAADYLRAFFLNAGIPSGLLKYKDIVGDIERERAKTKWRENYGGTTRKWHDLAILDGDVEYQEIGSKMNTLDLDKVFGQTETRITSAFQCPPILVGTWIGLMRATFSNIAFARRSFYSETMIPKWDSLSDRLTVDLASEFNKDIVIGFDYDQIEALQEEKTAVRQFALDGWDKGLLKRNEARKMVNMDQDPGGNIYKVQPGIGTQLPAAVPPKQLPEAKQPALLQRYAGVSETMDSGLPAWKVLHGLADSAAVGVKNKFILAIAAMRDDIDEDEIAALIAKGNVNAAVSAIGWDHFKEFEAALLIALLGLVRDAGVAGEGYLPSGVDGKFNTAAAAAQAWAAERAHESIALILAASQDAMRKVIQDGLLAGRTASEIASDVKAQAGLLSRNVDSLTRLREQMTLAGAATSQINEAIAVAARQLLDERAAVIAGNETILAVNEGLRELWRQLLAADIITRETYQRVWEVTPPEVCPVCMGIDGSVAPIDGPFEHGYEPGDVHVNCLIGDTAVIARDILAVTKRFYEGPVVTIVSARGYKITCTPNHKILTGVGWVPAGSINEGSEVLCDGRMNLPAHDKDDGHMPARIEDIVESFIKIPTTLSKSVEVSPKDFEGDGKGSEIAIICSNRELLHGGNVQLGKHIPQENLILTDADSEAKAGLGFTQPSSDALYLATYGSVGGCGVGATLINGHVGVAQERGFSAVPDNELVPFENSSNGAPADSEFQGNGLFADPGEVKTDNFGFQGSVGCVCSTDRNAITAQDRSHQAITDVKNVSNLDTAFPFPVQIDNIVNVERAYFCGHVYNLQTVSGWYLADSIITHNCKCVERLERIVA